MSFEFPRGSLASSVGFPVRLSCFFCLDEKKASPSLENGEAMECQDDPQVSQLRMTVLYRPKLNG
jgi:hypothetical protein